MSEQPKHWDYKRAPFQGKMYVSLLGQSNDTSTTVKHEYHILSPEVERAATIIQQNPDVQVSEIEAEFPEIKKRCGEERIQKLIDQASNSNEDRRFSVWHYCIEVLAEVTRYPFDTVRKYLYRESRQKKQSLP